MKNIKEKIFTILNDTPHLYEVFHADTSLVDHNIIEYNTSLRFKSYPRFQLINLPEPRKIESTFNSLLMERKSTKNFSKKINTDQLSSILYGGLGIKDIKNPYSSKRVIPSAGGLYSIEAYILSLNSSLPTGLYHYNSKLHGLEVLSKCYKKEIYSLFSESAIKKASIIICLSGKFDNVFSKYKDRGYRYTLIEAGHVGQNISLICTALDINFCSIGGYYDELINKFIHITPRREGILYTLALG